MRLPNGEQAFVDNIAKLRDYSLSPLHKEGRHKARVFASALGQDSADAQWLADRRSWILRGGPWRWPNSGVRSCWRSFQ
jgi:hypothetical protein